MTDDAPNQSATRRHLQQLSTIRFIALGCQLLALVFFSQVRPIGLPAGVLGGILAVYALIILLTWRRSFWQKAISEVEFFGHIVVDILFFSALLFYSGGGTNPFVFYYLVPISISAATLPRHFTLSAAVLSLTSYSLLLRFYVPIPALQPGHHGDQSGDLHIVGMWLNFCLSAALITYFVTRMSGELRAQEQATARHREDQLVDEQILGIATLAAGTAHELGTPLNTMKILVEELKTTEANDQVHDDIGLLERQIDQCRITLQQLVKTAGESTAEASVSEPVRSYFETLIERWQLLRPQVPLNAEITPSAPPVSARFHPSVSQALISLINNAADASPEKIRISVDWDHSQARLVITDHGAGVSPAIRQDNPRPFTSSKPDGMGLGLFLTKATLKRFGGEVSLQSKPQGTTTTVTLKFDP